jgi:DNA-binding PadR family transcriptional regulator
VTAHPITSAEREAMTDAGRSREDQLLVLLADRPGLSIAEMAEALGWSYQNGDPNRSLVQRTLTSLKAEKLVEIKRGTYALTRKGREAAAEARGDVPPM